MKLALLRIYKEMPSSISKAIRAALLFGANEIDHPYWPQNEDVPILTKVRIVSPSYQSLAPPIHLLL
ncbi:hypothetical protein [Paenibacillus sp. CECT 9249]|uniref:hypothetical protein n=1 Tax=Paenibacillus sp. CECT 9249 TaxID=2845385 RepID=UPI001E48F9E8|nr:hypothetical protein [Paenibacillus sp. CECT 9249]